MVQCASVVAGVKSSAQFDRTVEVVDVHCAGRDCSCTNVVVQVHLQCRVGCEVVMLGSACALHCAGAGEVEQLCCGLVVCDA